MWNSRSILAAATLIALLLLGFGVLSPEGLPQTKKLQAEAQKLEKQVQKAKAKNDQLKDEIELLRSDKEDARRFQEHVIRQELGFVRKDEKVLLLPEGSRTPIPTPKPVLQTAQQKESP